MRIPEGLFGANLEITRWTQFGGLSAQRINNRKFFCEQDEAFARGWEALGECRMNESRRFL